MDAKAERAAASTATQGLRQRLIHRLLYGVAALALLGMLLPLQRALLPGNQGLSWALDLFAHWQPWYAATWLACSLLLASTRRRWLLALPLFALPCFTASRPAAQSAEPAQLTIVIANVNIRQHDPQALLQWLREHPANIVVLTELSPAYAQRLAEAGNGGFGHALLHPLDSPPGLGILSDRPLIEPRLHADTLGALYLEARIELLGQPLRLFAVHPKPPMAVRKFKARDSLLRELAGSSDQATVIAGDLNATAWSSALYAAQQHNVRRVTGAAPTYPSKGAGLIGIGIDHVLVSPQLAGSFHQRGPNIGSDHLPVRVGIRWQAAPANVGSHQHCCLLAE